LHLAWNGKGNGIRGLPPLLLVETSFLRAELFPDKGGEGPQKAK